MGASYSRVIATSQFILHNSSYHMPYDHNSIEKKWQKYWSDNKTFKTENTSVKPKKYIKTGTHPAVITRANTIVFTEQLQSLGFSYDWDRVVDTTDPEYYKWTQWIFLELFKR